MSKTGRVTYNSFSELAEKEFKLTPILTRQPIKNEQKRLSLQQKYEAHNTCKSCGKPYTYIGGNVLCCTNPECKEPKSFKLLDDKAKNFVQSIFGE